MVKNHRGFTLVELMIAIGIIIIIAGVSTPNLVTGIPKYRVKAAARDLASKLRSARTKAIKENRSIAVVFNSGSNIYTIDGVTFPQNQNLAAHYGSGVRFGSGKATKDATDAAGTIPTDAVSFTDNTVQFNARGISSYDTGLGFVYLTNNRSDAYAVGVRNLAGSVVVRSWKTNDWYPQN